MRYSEYSTAKKTWKFWLPYIWKDFENAYIMNANDQVEYACELLKNDPKLVMGYHGLGISQGGQFLYAFC